MFYLLNISHIEVETTSQSDRGTETDEGWMCEWRRWLYWGEGGGTDGLEDKVIMCKYKIPDNLWHNQGLLVYQLN